MKFICYCCCLFLFGISPLTAQKEGNIWYFGNKAGLSFNSSPPKALTDGALSTLEGCATISDKNGNLLFYTDGIKVWNRKHKLMPNGTDLAGDPSSTQSGVIVPKPLYPGSYYIFTVDKEAGKKGLQYSEVNMNLDNGFGDVIVKNKFLLAPVSEKLTAVQHANKKDIWVIVHEWKSDRFKAFLVDENGINNSAVVSQTGFVHSGEINNSIGYLKASPDGMYLASVISRQKSNFELFRFDNASGKITKSFSISGISNPYGVEFSPDVTKLYSGSKDLAQIYQIDLTNGDSAATNNSRTLIADLGFGLSLSAFQLAPDGKIYVSRSGSTKLSVINQPNLKGKNCNFNANGVDLGGRSCMNGLPTFVQSFFIPVSGFTNTLPCVGEPIVFQGLSNVSINNWYWNFGDLESGTENESTQQNITHTFNKTGTYRVQLVIGKGDIYDTVIKYIEVPPKPQPDLGKNMLYCAGDSITLSAGTANEYLWNTGDTTENIKITKTGKYWVSVSNGACTASDTVNISFFTKEDMMLGNDTVACLGSKVSIKSKINGAKYLWSTGARDSAITIWESGAYWLQTVVGNCSVTDSVQINFIPPPSLYLGKDSMVCEGDSFLLDAGNAGADFEWSTGERTQKITISRGGIYWLKASAGDCFAIDTIRFYPCKAKVIMPNAFSPNADMVNDYFRVFGSDIAKGRLTVTNRWGQIIFQTDDIYKGWDGNYRGAQSPDGQYFWSLYYWEYDGTVLYPRVKKGEVYLLK